MKFKVVDYFLSNTNKIMIIIAGKCHTNSKENIKY